jgi:hypothetical protein
MKSMKSVSSKRLLKQLASVSGVAIFSMVLNQPVLASAPLQSPVQSNAANNLDTQSEMLIACGCGNRGGGGNNTGGNSGNSSGASRSSNTSQGNDGGWYRSVRPSLSCYSGADDTTAGFTSNLAQQRLNCRNLNNAASSSNPTETQPETTVSPQAK